MYDSEFESFVGLNCHDSQQEKAFFNFHVVAAGQNSEVPSATTPQVRPAHRPWASPHFQQCGGDMGARQGAYTDALCFCQSQPCM